MSTLTEFEPIIKFLIERDVHFTLDFRVNQSYNKVLFIKCTIPDHLAAPLLNNFGGKVEKNLTTKHLLEYYREFPYFIGE